MHEVFVLILFSRRKLQFLLFRLVNFLIFLLPLFFQYVFVGLKHILGVVYPQPIGNLNELLVFRQFQKGIEAGLLLVFGVQRTVVFHTRNSELDHMLFDVDDFIQILRIFFKLFFVVQVLLIEISQNFVFLNLFLDLILDFYPELQFVVIVSMLKVKYVFRS